MFSRMDRTVFLLLAASAWTWVSPASDGPSAQPRALTLAEARAAALQDSPALKAAEAAWRASLGAARQAASPLNPSLELRREDFGGDAPVQQVAPQESVTLSQPFRTAGKRAAQQDAARWASDAARQDLERQRLDLLAEVDRRFARLLGAQSSAVIAAENLATATEVASAVAALVEAGEVSPVELTRAENDREVASIDHANALRDQEVARRDLAALLGQESPRFDLAAGALAEEVALPAGDSPPPTLASLPDLARWDAEAMRLEAMLLLAKRSPWPDPTFDVGVRRYTATGERSYTAGVAIPLPLLTRNRGAVVEASSRLDQGRLERRAEEVRLQNAYGSARLVLARAHDEVRTLRERVLPNARRVFEALNEGYQRGQFRLLDLLEARRSLSDARLRYVEALVRLNVARADMDRLSPSGPAPERGDTP